MRVKSSIVSRFSSLRLAPYSAPTSDPVCSASAASRPTGRADVRSDLGDHEGGKQADQGHAEAAGEPDQHSLKRVELVVDPVKAGFHLGAEPGKFAVDPFEAVAHLGAEVTHFGTHVVEALVCPALSHCLHASRLDGNFARMGDRSVTFCLGIRRTLGFGPGETKECEEIGSAKLEQQSADR